MWFATRNDNTEASFAVLSPVPRHQTIRRREDTPLNGPVQSIVRRGIADLLYVSPCEWSAGGRTEPGGRTALCAVVDARWTPTHQNPTVIRNFQAGHQQSSHRVFDKRLDWLTTDVSGPFIGQHNFALGALIPPSSPE